MVWDGEHLKAHLIPTLCRGQGHLPLALVAPSPVQPELGFVTYPWNEMWNEIFPKISALAQCFQVFSPYFQSWLSAQPEAPRSNEANFGKLWCCGAVSSFLVKCYQRPLLIKNKLLLFLISASFLLIESDEKAMTISVDVWSCHARGKASNTALQRHWFHV